MHLKLFKKGMQVKIERERKGENEREREKERDRDRQIERERERERERQRFMSVIQCDKKDYTHKFTAVDDALDF